MLEKTKRVPKRPLWLVSGEWFTRLICSTFAIIKIVIGIQVRYLSDVREFVDGISRLTSIYPLTYLSVDEVCYKLSDLGSGFEIFHL